MSHDAFISYSAKDKAIADAVCAALESRGARCWIAPRDILHGMEWVPAIISAINGCRVVILIFSSSANDSAQVRREIQRAFEKGLIVIPFRVEDTPPSEALEFYIGPVHWLDALTPPMERHLEHLTETVSLLLSRPHNPAQAPFSSSQHSTDGASATPPHHGKKRAGRSRRTMFSLWAASVLAAVLLTIFSTIYITRLRDRRKAESVTPERMSEDLRKKGDELMKQQRYPEAETAYGRAIQLNPNDSGNKVGLVRAIEAQEALNRTSQRIPEPEQPRDIRKTYVDK